MSGDELASRTGGDASAAAESPETKVKKRYASSKYDFVKVRIWLDRHYYVLSRFITSRVLTVSHIPYAAAVKIALELKKQLVDLGILDVSQSTLEQHLFTIMNAYGYGANYISRMQMMNRFHYRRCPLLILICGTGCAGKSTVATRLGERLNMTNVLQTDLTRDLLQLGSGLLSPTPLWFRSFDSDDDVLNEYRKECRAVRSGMDLDVAKCCDDGKALILEGFHLDPSLFLEIIRRGNPCANAEVPPRAKSDGPAAAKTILAAGDDGRKAAAAAAAADDGAESAAPIRPIVIPFLLAVNEDEHRRVVRERFFREGSAGADSANPARVVEIFQVVQRYLLQFRDIVNYVPMDMSVPVENQVERLHDRVLEVIEQAYSTDWF